MPFLNYFFLIKPYDKTKLLFFILQLPLLRSNI